MLIIDHEQILKGSTVFRTGRHSGFFNLWIRKCFALDDNMKLDVEKVQAFLERHQGKQILVFGFTYLIWQKLYKQLKEAGIRLDLSMRS